MPREVSELRAILYKKKFDIQSKHSYFLILSAENRGDLIVNYDVKHTNIGGLVVFTDDGYVVSYYYPSVPDSEKLPKDIVFTTDISGSMSGEKKKKKKKAQARRSLIETIDKLRRIDHFQLYFLLTQLNFLKLTETQI